MSALGELHWAPVAIFLVTYALIAVESNIGSYLDRTATAFCGAVAMVLARSLSLDRAYQAIDWNTIIFLLGMMILVAHFQISHFFDWVAVRIAAVARTRFQLLVLLVFTAGILSAFFVNDTIVLIFTPIVLTITERLELPPVPYLIALAFSSNIGSAMSVTGNPQNALIGVSAHFSFLDFLAHLAPVSLVGLLLLIAVFALIFRRQVFGPLPARPPALEVQLDRRLLWKCGFAASFVVVLWVLGFSFPLVAISVGALILIIGRVRSGRIYHQVDWQLLLFFASLFVVIRGLETSGAIDLLIRSFKPWLGGGPVGQLFGVSAVMLVLANLVSNVPAVLLFRPLVGLFPNSHFVWLALASAATLAGNATPFGSVASLIVLQLSGPRARIGFWQFTRVGLLVMLLTSAAAIAILAVEFYLFPQR
jgi:Na+/H+ antiporter NhaD/arsenite permease-like protein